MYLLSLISWSGLSTQNDEFLQMAVCDLCFIKSGSLVQFLNNIITD